MNGPLLRIIVIFFWRTAKQNWVFWGTQKFGLMSKSFFFFFFWIDIIATFSPFKLGGIFKISKAMSSFFIIYGQNLAKSETIFCLVWQKITNCWCSEILVHLLHSSQVTMSVPDHSSKDTWTWFSGILGGRVKIVRI